MSPRWRPSVRRASAFSACACLALVGCSASSSTPPAGPADASGDGAPSAEAGAPSTEGGAPGTEAGAPTDLMGALGAAGFGVAPGHFDFIDMSQCCSQPTCFGNNPSSPYAGFYLPAAPGQTTPNPGTGSDGTSVVWRLREDEAIVYAGKTPPAASYFGFTPYLFTRDSNGKSDLLYASVGDTLNDLVISTSGTPNGAPGDAFAKDTVIVAAANATVEQRVRDALGRAGYDASIVNTIVLPEATLHLGLDDTADTLQVLERVALFADEAAGKAYVASPGGTVLRLTPTTPVAPNPLASPPPRPRGTKTTEASLQTSLTALRQAILARYAGLTATDLNVSERTPYQSGQFGPYCIAQSVNCNGDNRDTIYPVSDPFYLAQATSFVVMFGVNHAASGKATYSSFSVYDAKREMGVAAVDSRSMKGSASAYVPNDPNVDLLYAWKIARSCQNEPSCLEIPTGCPGIAQTDPAFLAARAYLEPPTKTGPDPAEVLMDGAIQFR